MDDLDRLYRRLLHNVRAKRPEYLQIPFTVQELYEQLIPYRHNRRELAIETNQDYEVAVARLLSGERGHVRTEPDLQEALQRELASPTGDPGIFKGYAQTPLSLTSPADASQRPLPTPANATALAPSAAQAPSAPPSPSSATLVTTAYDAPAPGETQPVAMHPPSVSLLSSLSHVEIPTGCKFCSGTLPEGRDATYCPHCGENLKIHHCPACGAEMEASWKFCVTCGRRAG